MTWSWSSQKGILTSTLTMLRRVQSNLSEFFQFSYLCILKIVYSDQFPVNSIRENTYDNGLQAHTIITYQKMYWLGNIQTLVTVVYSDEKGVI